ncbi:MAG: hypothetical protein A4E28_03054 [Methanocella sp. PtaU1.Bin125]|nr:MAG: hypothetical protein A4E28_03054 [Methanocella sp. PtaU1.Bin125]
MLSSPLYWSGWYYGAAIRLMHGQSLKRRYEYIAGLSTDKVIDVGCGTGKLSDYLSDEDYYFGIDLNERFLRHAKKQGRNVARQDALEYDRFSDFDVCVITDVLHHINPKHEEFLERVLKEVRKRVIVCEPYDVPSDPITKKLSELLDKDGFNKPPEWMDKDTLIEFYNRYDPEEITEFGKAVIAVYEKN